MDRRWVLPPQQDSALLSERALFRGDEKRARRFRVASWVAYLIGLPPWVAIFISWHNWIAASVEASGAPAMILGLVIALRGTTKSPPRWLDRLALICTPLGFGYSLWDYGGISTINQWLEIGLVLGFLVGTYQLAKERNSGYLWYVLMHVTCGWLMWIQGYPWLTASVARLPGVHRGCMADDTGTSSIVTTATSSTLMPGSRSASNCIQCHFVFLKTALVSAPK